MGNLGRPKGHTCPNCGRELTEERRLYCDDKCRRLYNKQFRKPKVKHNATLDNMIAEVQKYNEAHRTNFSYGEYYSRIKPRLERGGNDDLP